MILDEAGLARIRAIIADRLGLGLGELTEDELAATVRQRLGATGAQSAEAYAHLLGTRRGDGELCQIARRVTIGETYFFRNPNHFRVLGEVVLPTLSERASPRRRLRVLSAGCSSGEEAYTVRIVAREALGDRATDMDVLGVDVNPTVIEKARRGSYSAWSLRATSAAVKQRYFRPNGPAFDVAPCVKEQTAFEPLSLLDCGAAASGSFDVVFCRNVLIYFTPGAVDRALARFIDLLSPGGFLFLGDAESLRGTSTSFEVVQSHDTFYYRKRGGSIAFTPASHAGANESVVDVNVPAADISWIDAIERASNRIALLAEGSRSESDSQVRPSTAPPPSLPSAAREPSKHSIGRPRPEEDSIAALRDLLQRERFAEVLDRFDELAGRTSSPPEARLMRAIALTNCGRLREAREACGELLGHDSFAASAHYLLALCHEQDGDRDGAVRHDRRAAEIDPAFAMPRVHLGLIAKRAGDQSSARRELAIAEQLLGDEPALRLGLFGGGLTREALLQLCRTELSRSTSV